MLDGLRQGLVGDPSRIEQLRRRVDRDPASIAFAQLAEEYRRIGQHEDAVLVSRVGLERHPAYLSARVTLARALMSLDRYDEAEAELALVLGASPDNLSAARSLAEIRVRRGAPAHQLSPAVARECSAPVLDPVAHTPLQDAVASTDAVLRELEGWLAAILDDRAIRERRA
jgi:tetratricopeptide (TPR) repeat protein